MHTLLVICLAIIHCKELDAIVASDFEYFSCMFGLALVSSVLLHYQRIYLLEKCCISAYVYVFYNCIVIILSNYFN